ncbi:B-cell receptor CD22-like isoform X1 [Phyllopteryx taeniolatus]|uniref:B-cell receptor CD22-like isoform X1 n=1 Tax=Phyllopteryx taeniolatus TaxID=161469 RepID=UPI002AD2AB2E|nr:B-cell receptor CD22-like isoform X1 [Phyllopteryx taeniolatus]XP_061644458.1 B-cell receptor CD22-like isoform X1 [Phyllopteryx taeniolatus]
MKESGIILVFISGVLSGDWGVTFENQCALEGTTVLVRCQYDYPLFHIVTSTRWFQARWDSGRHITSATPHHFEYVGNSWKDCSLKIHNIKRADEGHYRFRFVTTLRSWTSKNTLYLSVKGLTAAVEPSTVTEGQSVSLTCRTDCGMLLHVWYRDGKVVPHPVFQASRKDSGRYYCAVLGQEKIKSASVALNVQYAPSNVVLSITPPGDVINGSAVTLGCSGDANPPIPPTGYSLYKGNQLISSGPSHTISLLQPSHSGLYHCKASNNISLKGITFGKSTELNLDVQFLPSAAEGSRVNMMCSNTANPATHSYIWYKWTSSSSLLQVGAGQMLSLPAMETPHTGIYLCQAWSQLEVINSTKVLLLKEENYSGHLSVRILAGLGACIFGILVLALLFLWKKQRKTEKKAMFTFQEVSSTATEDQSNGIYANINFYTPSPQPPARKYSKKQHENVMHVYGHMKTRRQCSHPQSRNNHLSIPNEDDEVTYSTVTIDVKKPHSDENRSQESRFQMGESADSVIYSTVANSS